MKYNHIVKYNGKYYAAGEDVPDDKPESAKGNNTAGDNEPLPFEPKKYTKTEINRMTTAELQKLAADYGVDGAYETSGGELKKQLIDLLGL